jgi:hypothetical protein
MIEFLDEGPGDIVGIRAAGKLSDADYRDVLAPRVQLLLKQFRKLKALFVMDETFEGWSLRAAWANTVFDVKHRRDFEKIAIVGAPKWEDRCIKTAAKWLMTGELRTFRRDQLTQAREWLHA